MAEYRTGNHWGVTIVREAAALGICADPSCPDRGDHPSFEHAQLVAVVVNGDTALAERICALLNGTEPPVGPPSRLGDLIVMHGPYVTGALVPNAVMRFLESTELNALRDELIELREIQTGREEDQHA